MEYVVNTAGNFKEKVNQQELIKWGESLGIGLPMNLDEAIHSLQSVGYTVKKLKEK